MYTTIDDYLIQRSALAGPVALVSDDEIERTRSLGRIIAPVLVRETKRRTGSGQRLYEIVGNEKSWILAQRIGWHEVPCVVLDVDDDELQKSLIAENSLPHAPVVDTNDPVQYSIALKQRLDADTTLTVKALAKELGRNRSDLQHFLRLADLPQDIRALVSAGRLSVGHARRLATPTITNEQRSRIAKAVVEKNISVRRLETLIRARTKAGQEDIEREANSLRLQLENVERALSEKLGCLVTVTETTIRINYAKDLDVLDGLLARLGVEYL